MSIDWDKQVKTRDGCEVRIYTNEGRLMHYPVVGEYRNGDGFQIGRWTSEGHWSCSCIHAEDRDLINVTQKHTVWVNVYEDESRKPSQVLACFNLCSYIRKDDADRSARRDRIACFQYTFTEGEGLE